MDSILQSGREGLIREAKLPMQELELKMQGGLMREGGRNRGILQYLKLTSSSERGSLVLPFKDSFPRSTTKR